MRTRSRSWPEAGSLRRPDPIHNTQYSAGEIRAICEEAEACRTYVLAHAYIPKAIIRAVTNGVRTIEHGNLLDAEAARVMAGHGAYLVPTSVTYRALHEHGRAFGFPEVSMQKLGDVLEVGLRAIEIARDARSEDRARLRPARRMSGPSIGRIPHQGGTCSGTMRAIRQATEVNAEILNMAGELGVIRAGALADLVVVDGDPLTDIGLLTGQGEHLPAILKDGRFFKNLL